MERERVGVSGDPMLDANFVFFLVFMYPELNDPRHVRMKMIVWKYKFCCVRLVCYVGT